MINSSLLLKGLLVAYLVILAVFVWEKNWVQAEYWVGALILTHAVSRMGA